jgi:hypothetical protein
MHSNALKIGTSEGVTGKAASLLTHSAKTFGVKAISSITIGGGTTTINVSNGPATSVSGAGSGELAGGPPAAAQPPGQVAERARNAGGAQAATRPGAQGVAGGPQAATTPGTQGVAVDPTQLDPPPPSTSPTRPTPLDEDVPLTTLEFVVVGDDSKPLSGIRFEVNDPSGTRHEATTNPEGLIRLDGLPAGQCEVSLIELAANA